MAGKGGKREGAGRKEGAKDKTAEDLMAELGCPAGWISPLYFCLAVMNNDKTLLKGMTGKGNTEKHITMGQRIFAARTAMPFLHQKLPEIVDLKPGDSWAALLREAEERERLMKAQDNEEGRTTH